MPVRMSRDRWPPTTFTHAFRGTAPAMTPEERHDLASRKDSPFYVQDAGGPADPG